LSAETHRDTVERAIDRARRAGASAVDAILIESDSVEARVRAAEIDFVTQARQRIPRPVRRARDPFGEHLDERPVTRGRGPHGG
jgi:hypothetical protein